MKYYVGLVYSIVIWCYWIVVVIFKDGKQIILLKYYLYFVLKFIFMMLFFFYIVLFIKIWGILVVVFYLEKYFLNYILMKMNICF